MIMYVNKAGVQGRNLKAEPDTETTRDTAFWFAPYDFLILISYTIQDHLPRVCTNHSELDSPISSIHQDYAPTVLPTDQSDRGIFSTEVSFSQMAVACVKLKTTMTKTYQKTHKAVKDFSLKNE